MVVTWWILFFCTVHYIRALLCAYSLKRGVVVSVHHRIPSDSPFKSYRDMKRYWKNTVCNTRILQSYKQTFDSHDIYFILVKAMAVYCKADY